MKFNCFSTYFLSIIILIFIVLNAPAILIFGGEVLEIIMFLTITFFFDILRMLKTLLIIVQ